MAEAHVEVDDVGAVGVALRETLSPGRGRQHQHRRHQLLYAASGLLTLRVGPRAEARWWRLPPDRAAWIAAGVRHSVDVTRSALLQTVYFDADLLSPPTSAVFALPPLGRALLQDAQRFDREGDSRLRRRYLETLALLALEWSAHPLTLELVPSLDSVLRKADAFLRGHLAETVSLRTLASHVGVSERTLSRRMRRAWGEGLRARQTRHRVLAAIDRLADAQISALAYELGFAHPSAFAQAFKRLTGETPSSMQRRMRGAP